MTRKDWVLLAINCVGEGHLSPAQLQKSLFLLKENKHSAVGRKSRGRVTWGRVTQSDMPPSDTSPKSPKSERKTEKKNFASAIT